MLRRGLNGAASMMTVRRLAGASLLSPRQRSPPTAVT